MVYRSTYMIYMIYIYDIYDILFTCFLTWILFEIKWLQTGLKLPLFENCNPLNVEQRAEGLMKVNQIPYISFQPKSQFSFKLCNILQCHDT